MGKGHLYTVPAAQSLRNFFDPAEVEVHYDHGVAPAAHQLVVWFGEAYTPPFSVQKLAHLDLAVIQRKVHGC